MCAQPENNESHGRTQEPPHGIESPSWYYVCTRCDAKWFAKQESIDCPRCGLTIHSTVRLTPPWLRDTEQL